MAVWGGMFVTESFSQADQWHSPHTQTLHMSADRRIICTERRRSEQGSSSIQWKTERKFTERFKSKWLPLKGLERQQLYCIAEFGILGNYFCFCIDYNTHIKLSQCGLTSSLSSCITCISNKEIHKDQTCSLSQQELCFSLPPCTQTSLACN